VWDGGTLRIAVGGIAHETNTFNALPTELEAFEIHKDEDLLRDDAVRSLLRSGIEVKPLIYAAAPPSGLIKKDAYNHLKDDLLRRIKASDRLDGICLFLHGAMEVDGIGSGEADLAKSIREAVGDEVLISASLDLHGNIASELTRYADILTAYRTAPHIDVIETKVRAASLLVKCISTRTRPVSVTVRPPLLLPGEMAVTTLEPALSLYRRLEEVDESTCVLDSSLLIGMAWADTSNAGASVLVVAREKECLDVAYKRTCHLAKEFWKLRAEFRLDAPSGSIDETIENAESCPNKPVFISDSGDNITGGAAGDIPLFAQHLISSDAEDAVVAGILDPATASLCRQEGIGHRVKVEIGGKLDRVNGQPLEVRGEVTHASDAGAVVRTGGIDIVLTTRWEAFTTLDSFKSFGIDPLSRSIVVVKQGYLFPELRRVAALRLMALSPGFTDLQLSRLGYKNVRRPIHPLDKDFPWEPPPEPPV